MISAAIALDECKQLVQSLHQWRQQNAPIPPLLSQHGEELAQASHHFVFHICVKMGYTSLMKQIITAKLKLLTDALSFSFSGFHSTTFPARVSPLYLDHTEE